MEIKDIRDKIEKATIVVATVRDNKPYAIIVMYAKVKDSKIIITDNYMKNTVENIKNNPNIVLIFYENETGYRISGKASYYNSGKWLEFVKSAKENIGCPAKGAIIVNVEEMRMLR